MQKELSLDEIRIISLSILKYVDVICKENNITYYLAAGTLLGAVRHKGFIPWDDDIDIMIPRRDYEKLLRIFPKNDNYSFMSFTNTPDFPYAFGKIIDKRTVKKEPLRPKYQLIGVDIDVFPIDNYPDNLEEAKEWCKKIKKCNDTFLNICSPYGKGKNLMRTIVRNIIIWYRHMLDDMGIKTSRCFVRKMDALSQNYNHIPSEYCGIVAISAYGIKKRNRRSVFSDTIELEFEGTFFPAPIGYDEYLTDYYGDYMQLPPIDEQKTHHTYKAFWK